MRTATPWRQIAASKPPASPQPHRLRESGLSERQQDTLLKIDVVGSLICCRERLTGLRRHIKCAEEGALRVAAAHRYRYGSNGRLRAGQISQVA